MNWDWLQHVDHNQSSMRFARPGDFACYVGPSSRYAMGPWTRPFLAEDCDRLPHLQKCGMDRVQLDVHLGRLSEAMSKAFGWVPCCAGAATLTLLPCLAAALAGYSSPVLLVCCIFGPIFAACFAMKKSTKTVADAVLSMQAVAYELNSDLVRTHRSQMAACSAYRDLERRQ